MNTKGQNVCSVCHTTYNDECDHLDYPPLFTEFLEKVSICNFCPACKKKLQDILTNPEICEAYICMPRGTLAGQRRLMNDIFRRKFYDFTRTN